MCMCTAATGSSAGENADGSAARLATLMAGTLIMIVLPVSWDNAVAA